MTNEELDALDEQVARLQGWQCNLNGWWDATINPKQGASPYDPRDYRECPSYTRDRALVGELIDAVQMGSMIVCTRTNSCEVFDAGYCVFEVYEVDYQVGLCLALVWAKEQDND